MRGSLSMQDTPVGVGLVLDRHDAIQIAAAMFAVPAEMLSDEDIDDASREACNVMSGCLTQTLSRGPRLDFERPHEMAAAAYCALWRASRVLVSFEGSGNASRVTLTAFDRLHEPAAQGCPQ
jgi:hypothetical protein